MSISTMTDAIAYVYDVLTDDGHPVDDLLDVGVVQVVDHEAPDGLQGPTAMTVSSSTSDREMHTVMVRVYVVRDTLPREAQRILEAVTEVIDLLLADNAGPINWAFGVADQTGNWLAESTIEVGREDF